MKLTIFMRKISESLFDVIGKKMCIEQPLKMLCGSSKTNRHLRNAYLADPRGSIKVTVEGELVNQVLEDKTTKFTSVKLDSYNGLLVSTFPSTTIAIFEEDVMKRNKHDLSLDKKHSAAHLLIL